MDLGIEMFYSGNYAEAMSYFPEEIDQDLGEDDSFQYWVFRLVCRLRAGKDDVVELEYENLEDLGGRDQALRYGIDDLWDEIATVVGKQRSADPSMNPKISIERSIRRGDRLIAAANYADALEPLTKAIQIAIDCFKKEPLPVELQALEEVENLLAHARFSQVKALFALNRSLDAIPVLEDLRKGSDLSLETQARILLWTARCGRQQSDNPEATIALLQCALDTLVSSESASDQLRQSIVLEMAVANIKRSSSATSVSVNELVDMCRCPISLEIMVDPVTTPSGVSYERTMIEKHLETNGPFDPMTHAQLRRDQLYPNRMLKQILDAILRK